MKNKLESKTVLSKLLISQSGEQDRRTPLELFKKLDEEFHFELDPCTSTSKKGNLNTPYYFTKQQNGLIQDWKYSTIFINPPFKNMLKWVDKIILELTKSENKKTKTIVLLAPSKTETQWWHKLISSQYLKEIRFQKGRVTFEGYDNPFIIGITFFILTNKTKRKFNK